MNWAGPSLSTVKYLDKVNEGERNRVASAHGTPWLHIGSKNRKPRREDMAKLSVFVDTLVGSV